MSIIKYKYDGKLNNGFKSKLWMGKENISLYRIYSNKHLDAKQISLIVRCGLFLPFSLGKRMKLFRGAALIHDKSLYFI